MHAQKSFTRVRVLSVIALMTLLLACPSNQEQKQVGTAALDFSLTTIDGQEISLKDYRGKKIVHLVFWATWCPSCLTEMPKLKELHQAIANKPYEILAIDVGINDSLSKVRLYQERNQIPYKILFDEKGEVTVRYGVTGIPTQVVIDRDGNVQQRFTQLPGNTQGFLSQFFPS